MLNTPGGNCSADTIDPLDDQCEDPTSDEQKISRVQQRLPATLAQAAAVFQILGDHTRCKIVTALIWEELCVHEIAQIVGSSLSNVSHHLRLLRAERLVKYRKQQRRALYSLDDDHVITLISQVLEHVSHKIGRASCRERV